MAGSNVRTRWRMTAEARWLMAVTACLLAGGLAVLHSASLIVALNANQPGYHFALRQAEGAIIGMAAFAIVAKVDAEHWRRFAWLVMGVSILSMLVIILPGTESISGRMYGSRRYLFNGSLQPSEIAKFAIIVWTPMLLVKKGDAVRRLGKGLLPFVVVIGVLSLLAILEPDYSVAMMFCLIMAVMLFVGGARVAHFVFLVALAVPLLVQKASQSAYVRERVRSFMAHEQTEQARSSPTADQQYQSLVAIGSGGVLGVGFGNGNQQRGWLPLAYNDFVGSVIGEEFGFLGMAIVTLLFAGYAFLGFRIARQARSPYCALLAIGLTFTTVFTAFIHLAVVIGLVPNTGLTLPFVSYGRSNLILTLVMTGILVNVGSVREVVYGVRATDPMTARTA